MSRNHRLKETNGKSDHKTLTSANKRNAISTKFRAMKSPHLKDRDVRTASARKINRAKMLRSTGFPSSRACEASPNCPPSHCEGSRDPTINIQTKGIHNAREGRMTLAGSKRKSAKTEISQRRRARI